MSVFIEDKAASGSGIAAESYFAFYCFISRLTFRLLSGIHRIFNTWAFFTFSFLCICLLQKKKIYLRLLL